MRRFLTGCRGAADAFFVDEGEVAFEIGANGGVDGLLIELATDEAGVGQDAAERVVEFVCDGGGELAQ